MFFSLSLTSNVSIESINSIVFFFLPLIVVIVGGDFCGGDFCVGASSVVRSLAILASCPRVFFFPPHHE